jgi:peptidoglycan/LPS O-acetylase OafA/YrhL
MNSLKEEAGRLKQADNKKKLYFHVKGMPDYPDGPDWLYKGRIPCLDGLRAISILLVLLAHGQRTHGFPNLPQLRGFLSHGGIGVDVFFLISGFLITLLLVREYSGTQTLSLKNFYQRRFLRLFPAFFIYAIFIAGLTWVGFSQVEKSDWLGVFTYTVNFIPKPSWVIGHMWSLSIEEQFYLLWPPLLLWTGLNRAKTILMGYLITAPILRLSVYLFAKSYLERVDLWSPTRMDSIAFGCLLALLAFEPAFRERTRWTGWKALWIGLVAIGVLGASIAIGQEITGYAMLLGYTVHSAAIATFVWICLNNESSRFCQILQWKPVATVGILSYSIYLWQQLFLNPQHTSWICRWPVNFFLALAFASISYVFIESPFLRIKDRLRSSR